MEGFGARIFDVFGYEFSETVLVTWILMAVLLLVALIVRIMILKFDYVPTGFQNVIEATVEGISKMTTSTMGEKNKNFAPFIGTIMIFIAVANLSGLIGFKPPTSDINTTMALAIIVFIAIQATSIFSKGLIGHIKGMFQPIFVLFPINVIGDIAVPISLAFRLFGNVVGGLIISQLLYGALSSIKFASIPILQIGIPIVLHIYFDLFSGLLQSMIFVMLMMVYLSNAKE